MRPLPSPAPRAVRSALVLGALTFAAAPLCVASLFPARQHEVGVRPLAVVAADFDVDGRIDLATANEQSGDVAVLLGRGSDDFAPALRFAAGRSPSALAAADFDADGRLDLVAANSGSDELTLFAGRGDGTFAGPAHFATGTGPVALALADFDGDRRLDVVTANAYSDDLSILAGLPGGGFAPERRLGLGSGPLSIAAVDLDRDGAVDLVVALWISEQIAYLRNRGDGTFHPPVRTRLSDAPAAVRAADFDRDGRPDVAVALQGGGIQILGGDGAGGFRPPRTVADVGGPPAALEVVRLDAGDDPDLVVAAGAAVLLYGRGNGTFESPHRCGGLRWPAAVAAADLDRDGTTDLTFTTRSSDSAARSLDSAAIFLGRDHGACVGPVLTGEFDGRAMAVADFDGDRRLDVVALEGEAYDLVLRRGGGDGGFRPSEPIAANAGRGRLLAADFDRDGRMDLAQTRNERGEVSIRLGRGDGTFDPAGTFDAVGSPWDMAAGKLNGDAYPDLVVASGGPRDVAVLPGREDGTFGPPTRLQAGLAPTGAAIGDFDGDGRNDLLVLNFGDDNLAVFRGHGDGGFDPPDFFAVGGFPTSLALRPLGDGRMDVVIGHGRGRRVSVLRGLGDGLSTLDELPLVATAPWVVAVDDLDQDGRPDIVSGNRDTGNLSFLPGATAAPAAAGGSAATGMTFGAGDEPREVSIGDFDNDGRRDAALLLAGGIAVLLNESVDPGGPAVVDFTLRPAAPPGTFAVSWRTIAESEVVGFRLVALSRSGAVLPGDVQVECRECDTRLGAAYEAPVPRPPKGFAYYLDLLRRDGTAERFGPASRSGSGRGPSVGKGGAVLKEEKSRPRQERPAPHAR